MNMNYKWKDDQSGLLGLYNNVCLPLRWAGSCTKLFHQSSLCMSSCACCGIYMIHTILQFAGEISMECRQGLLPGSSWSCLRFWMQVQPPHRALYIPATKAWAQYTLTIRGRAAQYCGSVKAASSPPRPWETERELIQVPTRSHLEPNVQVQEVVHPLMCSYYLCWKFRALHWTRMQSYF